MKIDFFALGDYPVLHWRGRQDGLAKVLTSFI